MITIDIKERPDKKCPNCGLTEVKNNRLQFRLLDFEYNNEEGCYVDTCECKQCKEEFKMNLWYLNKLDLHTRRKSQDIENTECVEVLNDFIIFIRNCYIAQDIEGGVTTDYMADAFHKIVSTWRTSVKALQYAVKIVKRDASVASKVSVIKDVIASFETEIHNLLEEENDDEIKE